MSTLPPPVSTVARVLPGATFTSAAGSATIHLLARDVTRCGHRTAAGWARHDTNPPAVRLCARCTAGLPATTRQQLDPTAAELAAVHEREARVAAAALVDLLAQLRQAAMVDGSAWETTRLIHAQQVPALAQPRGRNADPLTRADRNAYRGGHIAHAWPMSLLALLNELDPTRPDTPGRRVFVLDEPEPGTPVDVGGTYDGRAYDWRRKGHT